MQFILNVTGDSFSVYNVADEPNAYALSVRTQIGESLDIQHFKICFDQTTRKLFITTQSKFDTLDQLITYYKSMSFDLLIIYYEHVAAFSGSLCDLYLLMSESSQYRNVISQN